MVEIEHYRSTPRTAPPQIKAPNSQQENVPWRDLYLRAACALPMFYAILSTLGFLNLKDACVGFLFSLTAIVAIAYSLLFIGVPLAFMRFKKPCLPLSRTTKKYIQAALVGLAIVIIQIMIRNFTEQHTGGHCV